MENMTFDDAIAKLEGILDKLENEHNLSFEEQQKLYQEAEELKNHCRALLDKEKEEIFRIAKENNISLDDLNLDEDYEDDDEDYDDDDDDDEDEDESDDEEDEEDK